MLHKDPLRLMTAVNAVSNMAIAPRRAAAIVASFRDEGISILEWVAHHRVLGFEGIFIYTNDNVDGSEVLLKVLADNAVISLLLNELGPGTDPPRKCYNHALHLFRDLRDYQWALFIDADEFLMLGPRFGHSIARYLREAEATVGEALSAICLHWRWYGSDKAFERTRGCCSSGSSKGTTTCM